MLAVRRAAERFTADDAAQALELLETYRRLYEHGLHDYDVQAARAVHIEFHMRIYTASGSAWLLRAIRPLVESSERYRVLSLPARGTITQRHQEHLAILSSCAAHDPEGASIALREHLAKTVNALAEKLEFGAPPQLAQVPVATYLDAGSSSSDSAQT
jgi:DNA-binding GntR family transcriptional regulator